jgi:hypothetical protein
MRLFSLLCSFFVCCDIAQAQIVIPPQPVTEPIIVSQLGLPKGTTPPRQAGQTVKGPVISAPGRWGQIESAYVYMEAASSLIEKFTVPNTRSRWVFPADLAGSLPELLRSIGLSTELITTLMSEDKLTRDSDFIYLFPPDEALLAMPPEQRSEIASVLRKVPANEYYADPVLIVSGDIDSWFLHSDLTPSQLNLIKKLSYLRGSTLAFSDIPLLISQASGEAEARKILKACTRTRTLMAKLVIDEKTDLQSVMEYWTTGLNLRKKDVLPILQSLQDFGGQQKLDIVHLLPALPRKFLLTYPDTSMSKEGLLPDCHWSSLNFFNYDAQPYLLDSRLATSAVLERFSTIEAPYKFGDILFFLDSQGDAFHSCVYLADDIVYTKNGRNLLSPWILMHMDDLQKVYLYDGKGRIQAFRNKVANPDKTIGAE